MAVAFLNHRRYCVSNFTRASADVRPPRHGTSVAANDSTTVGWGVSPRHFRRGEHATNPPEHDLPSCRDPGGLRPSRTRPAGHLGDPRPRHRLQRGSASRRRRHRAQSGERRIPPGCFHPGWNLLSHRDYPGPVRDHRRALGLPQVLPQRHPARGREDRLDRHSSRSGGSLRRADGFGRGADRRRHFQGGGGKPHQPRPRLSALLEPQLRGLHRAPPRRRSQHLDRVVRVGLRERERPGRPQQQLSDGRRQQQRRRDRPARRDPGAPRHRIHPGVPGSDLPVRRRVRTDQRGRDQRGHQAGAATSSRGRPSDSFKMPPTPPRTTS